MKRFKFAFLPLGLFLSQMSMAGDLSNLKACVEKGYSALTNRRAISVAVLDSDNVEYLLFGEARPEQIFEIGSVTKTCTGSLLAQAVLEKRVQLDDAIPDEFQKAGATITYRHLTTHKSGIVSFFPNFKITNPGSPYDGMTEAVFKQLYSQNPLTFPPGSKWEYSNNGTALLGLILSEKYGQSYEKLVREKILQPLGMNESFFEVPANLMDRFPAGQLIDPQGAAHPIPHWDLYKTAIDPAGGLRATISDMVKYARANLNPNAGALKDAVRISQTPLEFVPEQNLWMGMNWILQPQLNLIWHNGQTYGFNSILAISKKTNQAIVALADTTVQKVGPKGEVTFDTSLQEVAFQCLK